MMTLQFIGNVHADEPVGRELLILLANWICNNHMKDPLVRLIAENMHLHIFPSMNPDGYALKRLGNENNTVLNRDFPYQVTSCNFGFLTSFFMKTKLNLKIVLHK
ncbi:hypothetical protein CISIN_1g034071mg [Citrus sinensis]|uniref:Peptidase M14 domain-containing protein n=1 Tax=Citrus sinensis TaxID=2711 RepID=A0A067DJI4_CITSI|nr:hypothetical protein CISIN_1g034071mg [Citrus sinensis]